jgi:hypothetical protein
MLRDSEATALTRLDGAAPSDARHAPLLAPGERREDERSRGPRGAFLGIDEGERRIYTSA